SALLQLNAEKNISREALIRTVEEAIQSAYRRVSPGNENVNVEVDPETGRIRVYRAKTVVGEVEDPELEFSLEEARPYKPDAKVGDLVEFEQVDASTFGRIHAQTAKQVVLQRLREAEREQTFGRYVAMEGEIITGTVSRAEPRAIILELGREPDRVEAILATTEPSPMEHYRIGQHVKAYVLEVRRTTKGPQIFVSRTHKGFLRRLFELEVPEIHAGTVEIRAIAREAGSRSKVAVASRQEGLDPVGATVGQRGGRVQAVVAELGGEKVDIIPWSDDPAVLVANALSPAQVVGVRIDEENRIATVTVPERMLSLAIGREGQNARLAAKMTGWRIDIRSDQAPAGERVRPGEEGTPARTDALQEETPGPDAAVPQDAPAAEETSAPEKASPPEEPSAPEQTATPEVVTPAEEPALPEPIPAEEAATSANASPSEDAAVAEERTPNGEAPAPAEPATPARRRSKRGAETPS
ncbi:MAG TPA: transcription termination factor NusA, partial [Candidatus Limnocylindrales bacterium]|nr:transcription termination factor NusA [Candidatus Limnocylindrales bacterium]